MLKTNINTIALSKIDTDDHTCLLDPSVRPDKTLVQSIQAIGLINPPLVAGKKDGTYSIVCGFRRINSCKRLRWNDVDVRVLKGEYTPYDLLQYAIWDNRSHRDLNVVEQARAIQKLGPFVPEERHLAFFSALLGFPSNRKVFEKITLIGLLPEELQVGLVQDRISVEAAASLQGLSIGDTLLLFDLLANLRMSQNKQKEFITLMKEIAIIEDLNIASVSRQLGIEAILKRTDLNRNEKSATIRKQLKERRFPTVARAEKRITKAVKELKLNNTMHITPPPYFEGESYVLRMDFKSSEDLEACRESLGVLLKNPALKRLLKPYE